MAEHEPKNICVFQNLKNLKAFENSSGKFTNMFITSSNNPSNISLGFL
jgi:hypothetical protein